MIIGLPGQTEDSFVRDIERLAALRPEHISLYMMELHEKTPLAHLIREGKMDIPGDYVLIRCYESAKSLLEREGYSHYEISNYSLPNKETKHNLKYWTDQCYLGCGSSAHSYWEGKRITNVDEVKVYIERIMEDKSALAHEEPFGLERRVSEAIFTGLRLMKGVDQKAFKRRYGIDISERYGSEISQHVKNGLLELEGENLRLTEKGIMLSNEVFSSFV
jgi:oxygen-independent coproporphyrinogen-3 oxidase